MTWSNSAVVDGVLVNSTSPTELAGEHGTWMRAVIHNRLGTLYIKMGTDASSSDYTYRLNKDAILETENYGGPITAVTASGAGFVDVTFYRG